MAANRETEVAVIGAGPFALTFVCFAMFESNNQFQNKFTVIDPEGK